MRLFKEMFVILIGVLAFIYLINPTAGVFEFIPDVIPVIGNIDEGTASLILISVLRYYGLDLSRLFGGRNGTAQNIPDLGRRNVQNQQGRVNPNTQTTDAQYQRLQQEEAQRKRNG
jgi:hypothetical protein